MRKIKKIFSLFWVEIIATCIFTSACKENIVFSEYRKIDVESGWKTNQILPFQILINDTELRYNVFIHLRNENDYLFRNLFMFLNTHYPDKTQSIDTLECILADERGKWLGGGMGDSYDNAILFKQNTKFHQKGTYVFSLEQAMRYGNKNFIQPLLGITQVGISVEKAK